MVAYAVDTSTNTTVVQPTEEIGRSASLRGMDLSLTSYSLANSAIRAKSGETREAYARLFFKVKHSVINKRLKFGIPAELVKTLEDIATRAVNGGMINNRLFLVMDLWQLAANAKGYMPIGRLLHADGRVFAHDVAGIMQHLDRKTGKLVGFVPVSFPLPVHTEEDFES